MSKPWSKLKARIEALWVDDLGLAIHCTSYSFASPGPPVRVSRHWLALNKVIVWDFPGPFLGEGRKRGGPVDHAHPGFANGGSVIGELIRDYLDRAKEDLFEPFPNDRWEFTDMLRAADRRLGRAALDGWAHGLDAGHPAHILLTRRSTISAEGRGGAAPSPASRRA